MRDDSCLLMFEKPLPTQFFVSEQILGLLLSPSFIFCVSRSASWHCGCLSSSSTSPTTISFIVWCCATWKKGITWRINHRMSGSPWRTGSSTMPCKDLHLTFDHPENSTLKTNRNKVNTQNHCGFFHTTLLFMLFNYYSKALKFSVYILWTYMLKI